MSTSPTNAPAISCGDAVQCRKNVLPATGEQLLMSLQFHRAVEDMEIWSANSDGFSFVISYETPTGPGFHGQPGYVASWRLLDQRSGAIKIGGSPFKTLADAEEACSTMLKHLKSTN